MEQDPEKIAKLAAFRDEVKRAAEDSPVHRVYCEFNDLHEFEVAATQSIAELRRLLDKHRTGPAPGAGASRRICGRWSESHPRNWSAAITSWRSWPRSASPRTAAQTMTRT